MRALQSPCERVTCQSEFVCLFVRLFFAYLLCSSVFGAKALKNTCLRFAISNFREKLQNIIEIGLKKYGVVVQKSLLKQSI